MAEGGGGYFHDQQLQLPKDVPKICFKIFVHCHIFGQLCLSLALRAMNCDFMAMAKIQTNPSGGGMM